MEEKNTEIYIGFPFRPCFGVRPLFVIENVSVTVFHYDEKCLQIVVITEDSFDSLIFNAKKPHYHQSPSPLKVGEPLGL